MHLLMIAPEQIAVPPPKGGSVEICMLAIAKRLSQQHKVTLISRRYARYPHKTKIGNLEIIRVSAISPRRYIRAVVAQVRGKQFDWIQIDNRPRFITRVRQAFPYTPISLFLHSLTFVTKPMISRADAEKCLNKADAIIANSSSLQSELRIRFPRIAGRIKLVHLGVDLEQFRPLNSAKRALLRKKHGLQGSYIFAFAGRIIPRKGLPVLLKAMSHVSKAVSRVKLIIAGRGTTQYMLHIKKRAKRLGISTVFVGYKSHRNMRSLYGVADCLVCPSQKHEAFGLVNVEAMATGIPVIASRIGGIDEIVKHGSNGFLIDNYRDSHAFANLMLMLIRDRTYSQELGRKARQDMIQQFSWENTVQSLCEIYTK